MCFLLGMPQLQPRPFQAKWGETGPCSSEWPGCLAQLRAGYVSPKASGQLLELTGPFQPVLGPPLWASSWTAVCGASVQPMGAWLSSQL